MNGNLDFCVGSWFIKLASWWLCTATPWNSNREEDDCSSPSVKLDECQVACMAPHTASGSSQGLEFFIFGLDIKNRTVPCSMISAQSTEFCQMLSFSVQNDHSGFAKLK